MASYRSLSPYQERHEFWEDIKDPDPRRSSFDDLYYIHAHGYHKDYNHSTSYEQYKGYIEDETRYNNYRADSPDPRESDYKFFERESRKPSLEWDFKRYEENSRDLEAVTSPRPNEFLASSEEYRRELPNNDLNREDLLDLGPTRIHQGMTRDQVDDLGSSVHSGEYRLSDYGDEKRARDNDFRPRDNDFRLRDHEEDDGYIDIAVDNIFQGYRFDERKSRMAEQAYYDKSVNPRQHDYHRDRERERNCPYYRQSRHDLEKRSGDILYGFRGSYRRWEEREYQRGVEGYDSRGSAHSPEKERYRRGKDFSHVDQDRHSHSSRSVQSDKTTRPDLRSCDVAPRRDQERGDFRRRERRLSREDYQRLSYRQGYRSEKRSRSPRIPSKAHLRSSKSPEEKCPPVRDRTQRYNRNHKRKLSMYELNGPKKRKCNARQTNASAKNQEMPCAELITRDQLLSRDVFTVENSNRDPEIVSTGSSDTTFRDGKLSRNPCGMGDLRLELRESRTVASEPKSPPSVGNLSDNGERTSSANSTIKIDTDSSSIRSTDKKVPANMSQEYLNEHTEKVEIHPAAIRSISPACCSETRTKEASTPSIAAVPVHVTTRNSVKSAKLIKRKVSICNGRASSPNLVKDEQAKAKLPADDLRLLIMSRRQKQSKEDEAFDESRARSNEESVAPQTDGDLYCQVSSQRQDSEDKMVELSYSDPDVSGNEDSRLSIPNTTPTSCIIRKVVMKRQVIMDYSHKKNPPQVLHQAFDKENEKAEGNVGSQMQRGTSVIPNFVIEVVSESKTNLPVLASLPVDKNDEDFSAVEVVDTSSNTPGSEAARKSHKSNKSTNDVHSYNVRHPSDVNTAADANSSNIFCEYSHRSDSNLSEQKNITESSLYQEVQEENTFGCQGLEHHSDEIKDERGIFSQQISHCEPEFSQKSEHLQKESNDVRESSLDPHEQENTVSLFGTECSQQLGHLKEVSYDIRESSSEPYEKQSFLHYEEVASQEFQYLSVESNDRNDSSSESYVKGHRLSDCDQDTSKEVEYLQEECNDVRENSLEPYKIHPFFQHEHSSSQNFEDLQEGSNDLKENSSEPRQYFYFEQDATQTCEQSSEENSGESESSDKTYEKEQQFSHYEQIDSLEFEHLQEEKRYKKDSYLKSYERTRQFSHCEQKACQESRHLSEDNDESESSSEPYGKHYYKNYEEDAKEFGYLSEKNSCSSRSSNNEPRECSPEAHKNEKRHDQDSAWEEHFPVTSDHKSGRSLEFCKQDYHLDDHAVKFHESSQMFESLSKTSNNFGGNSLRRRHEQDRSSDFKGPIYISARRKDNCLKTDNVDLMQCVDENHDVSVHQGQQEKHTFNSPRSQHCVSYTLEYASPTNIQQIDDPISKDIEDYEYLDSGPEMSSGYDVILALDNCEDNEVQDCPNSEHEGSGSLRLNKNPGTTNFRENEEIVSEVPTDSYKCNEVSGIDNSPAVIGTSDIQNVDKYILSEINECENGGSSESYLNIVTEDFNQTFEAIQDVVAKNSGRGMNECELEIDDSSSSLYAVSTRNNHVHSKTKKSEQFDINKSSGAGYDAAVPMKDYMITDVKNGSQTSPDGSVLKSSGYDHDAPTKDHGIIITQNKCVDDDGIELRRTNLLNKSSGSECEPTVVTEVCGIIAQNDNDVQKPHHWDLSNKSSCSEYDISASMKNCDLLTAQEYVDDDNQESRRSDKISVFEYDDAPSKQYDILNTQSERDVDLESRRSDVLNKSSSENDSAAPTRDHNITKPLLTKDDDYTQQPQSYKIKASRESEVIVCKDHEDNPVVRTDHLPGDYCNDKLVSSGSLYDVGECYNGEEERGGNSNYEANLYRYDKYPNVDATYCEDTVNPSSLCNGENVEYNKTKERACLNHYDEDGVDRAKELERNESWKKENNSQLNFYNEAEGCDEGIREENHTVQQQELYSNNDNVKGSDSLNAINVQCECAQNSLCVSQNFVFVDQDECFKRRNNDIKYEEERMCEYVQQQDTFSDRNQENLKIKEHDVYDQNNRSFDETPDQQKEINEHLDLYNDDVGRQNRECEQHISQEDVIMRCEDAIQNEDYDKRIEQKDFGNERDGNLERMDYNNDKNTPGYEGYKENEEVCEKHSDSRSLEGSHGGPRCEGENSMEQLNDENSRNISQKTEALKNIQHQKYDENHHVYFEQKYFEILDGQCESGEDANEIVKAAESEEKKYSMVNDNDGEQEINQTDKNEAYDTTECIVITCNEGNNGTSFELPLEKECGIPDAATEVYQPSDIIANHQCIYDCVEFRLRFEGLNSNLMNELEGSENERINSNMQTDGTNCHGDCKDFIAKPHSERNTELIPTHNAAALEERMDCFQNEGREISSVSNEYQGYLLEEEGFSSYLDEVNSTIHTVASQECVGAGSNQLSRHNAFERDSEEEHLGKRNILLTDENADEAALGSTLAAQSVDETLGKSPISTDISSNISGTNEIKITKTCYSKSGVTIESNRSIENISSPEKICKEFGSIFSTALVENGHKEQDIVKIKIESSEEQDLMYINEVQYFEGEQPVMKKEKIGTAENSSLETSAEETSATSESEVLTGDSTINARENIRMIFGSTDERFSSDTEKSIRPDEDEESQNCTPNNQIYTMSSDISDHTLDEKEHRQISQEETISTTSDSEFKKCKKKPFPPEKSKLLLKLREELSGCSQNGATEGCEQIGKFHRSNYLFISSSEKRSSGMSDSCESALQSEAYDPECVLLNQVSLSDMSFRSAPSLSDMSLEDQSVASISSNIQEDDGLKKQKQYDPANCFMHVDTFSELSGMSLDTPSSSATDYTATEANNTLVGMAENDSDPYSPVSYFPLHIDTYSKLSDMSLNTPSNSAAESTAVEVNNSFADMAENDSDPYTPVAYSPVLSLSGDESDSELFSCKYSGEDSCAPYNPESLCPVYLSMSSASGNEADNEVSTGISSPDVSLKNRIPTTLTSKKMPSEKKVRLESFIGYSRTVKETSKNTSKWQTTSDKLEAYSPDKFIPLSKQTINKGSAGKSTHTRSKSNEVDGRRGVDPTKKGGSVDNTKHHSTKKPNSPLSKKSGTIHRKECKSKEEYATGSKRKSPLESVISTTFFVDKGKSKSKNRARKKDYHTSVEVKKKSKRKDHFEKSTSNEKVGERCRAKSLTDKKEISPNTSAKASNPSFKKPKLSPRSSIEVKGSLEQDAHKKNEKLSKKNGKKQMFNVSTRRSAGNRKTPVSKCANSSVKEAMHEESTSGDNSCPVINELKRIMEYGIPRTMPKASNGTKLLPEPSVGAKNTTEAKESDTDEHHLLDEGHELLERALEESRIDKSPKAGSHKKSNPNLAEIIKRKVAEAEGTWLTSVKNAEQVSFTKSLNSLEPQRTHIDIPSVGLDKPDNDDGERKMENCIGEDSLGTLKRNRISPTGRSTKDKVTEFVKSNDGKSDIVMANFENSSSKTSDNLEIKNTSVASEDVENENKIVQCHGKVPTICSCVEKSTVYEESTRDVSSTIEKHVHKEYSQTYLEEEQSSTVNEPRLTEKQEAVGDHVLETEKEKNKEDSETDSYKKEKHLVTIDKLRSRKSGETVKSDKLDNGVISSMEKCKNNDNSNTGDVEMQCQTANAESFRIEDKNNDNSNTGDVEMQCQTANAESSRIEDKNNDNSNAGDVEMQCQTVNAESSRIEDKNNDNSNVGDVEMQCQTANAESSRIEDKNNDNSNAGDVEMQCQTANAESSRIDEENGNPLNASTIDSGIKKSDKESDSLTDDVQNTCQSDGEVNDTLQEYHQVISTSTLKSHNKGRLIGDRPKKGIVIKSDVNEHQQISITAENTSFSNSKNQRKIQETNGVSNEKMYGSSMKDNDFYQNNNDWSKDGHPNKERGGVKNNGFGQHKSDGLKTGFRDEKFDGVSECSKDIKENNMECSSLENEKFVRQYEDHLPEEVLEKGTPEIKNTEHNPSKTLLVATTDRENTESFKDFQNADDNCCKNPCKEKHTDQDQVTKSVTEKRKTKRFDMKNSKPSELSMDVDNTSATSRLLKNGAIKTKNEGESKKQTPLSFKDTSERQAVASHDETIKEEEICETICDAGCASIDRKSSKLNIDTIATSISDRDHKVNHCRSKTPSELSTANPSETPSADTRQTYDTDSKDSTGNEELTSSKADVVSKYSFEDDTAQDRMVAVRDTKGCGNVVFPNEHSIGEGSATVTNVKSQISLEEYIEAQLQRDISFTDVSVVSSEPLSKTSGNLATSSNKISKKVGKGACAQRAESLADPSETRSKHTSSAFESNCEVTRSSNKKETHIGETPKLAIMRSLRARYEGKMVAILQKRVDVEKAYRKECATIVGTVKALARSKNNTQKEMREILQSSLRETSQKYVTELQNFVRNCTI